MFTKRAVTLLLFVFSLITILGGTAQGILVPPTGFPNGAVINTTDTYQIPSLTGALIPAGKTLRIERGATFEIGQDVDLDILGNIVITAPTETVTFRPLAPATQWGALRILATSGATSSIQRLKMEGAGGQTPKSLRLANSNLPNHCIVLSNLAHTLQSVTFDSQCLGVPVLLEPPLQQTVSGLVVPVGFNNPPNRINAIGVADIKGNAITRVNTGTVNMLPAGGVLNYYLPQSLLINTGVTWTIAPQVDLLLAKGVVLRVLGSANIQGTSAVDPITLRPLSASDANAWGCLQFLSDTTPSILRNAAIQYAGAPTSVGSDFDIVFPNVPTPCVVLSSNNHILDNVSFSNINGVPVIAVPPVIQSFSNLRFPNNYTNFPGRIGAICVVTLNDTPQSLVEQGDSVLNEYIVSDNVPPVSNYYFSKEIQFDENATLQVNAGVQIYCASDAYIRCLGYAEFLGTESKPIQISPLPPDENWCRVELMSRGNGIMRNVIFRQAGNPFELPVFNQDGVFIQVSNSATPQNTSLIIARGDPEITNLTFESCRGTMIVQDVLSTPGWNGTLKILTPGAGFIPWVALHDFRDGREDEPILISGDQELPLISSILDPGGTPPDYYLDRDVVIPERSKLLISNNDPVQIQNFVFSPTDTLGLNFNTLKTEFIVAGALQVTGGDPNRVRFTSIPSTETEFNKDKEAGSVQLSDTDILAGLSGDKPKTPKVQGKPFSAHWGGFILMDQSDDLLTHLDYTIIENAITGVQFLSSSGKLTNSIIQDCWVFGVDARDRSFPTLDSNLIQRNGWAGVYVRKNSGPRIANNVLIDHFNSFALAFYDFSNPVLVNNTITGNAGGIYIATGSVPNLGKVAGDPAEDPDPDPGVNTDDGGNEISNNVNGVGLTVNLVNNTPNRIFAENNSWGFTTYPEIDATIFDDEESGLVSGLLGNAGQVDFIPVLGFTLEPTPTSSSTPTVDPTIASSTPTFTPSRTSTPIPQVPAPTLTPTASITPVSSQIVGSRTWSGLVRVNQNVVVGANATLRIMPGTRVLIEGASTEIRVDSRGKILAEGTREQPIFFFAPVDGKWGGIRVLGSDFNLETLRSVFTYCVFQRSGKAALKLENVTTRVSHCEFRDNWRSLEVTGGPSTAPLIRNNMFVDNETSFRVDVSGVVGGSTEALFNLGKARTPVSKPSNLDPGFNTFIKNGIIPNGIDLEAANYFTAQKFFADENLFLAPTGEGKYAVIKDAALDASGRIVNNFSGGSTLSVVSPAILRNQISDATGEFKTIADDEIWAGTVVLSASRNTIIPPGVTVTILPGTTITFPKGEANGGFSYKPSLRVYGRLLALGSRNNPIRFQSEEAIPGEFDWGGIEFIGPDEKDEDASVLEFVEIRHAEIGITFYTGVRTQVRNSIIEKAGESCVVVLNAEPVDEYPTFPDKPFIAVPPLKALQNKILKAGDPFNVPKPSLYKVYLLGSSSGEYGLLSSDSRPKLRQSAIGVNPQSNDYPFRPFRVAGIWVTGTEVPDLGDQTDPGRNLIFGTADLAGQKFEIVQNSAMPMDAKGNYWLGHENNLLNLGLLDGNDSSAAGKVAIDPVLAYPPSVLEDRGDLDQDAYILPLDYIRMMASTYRSIPYDHAFNPQADLNNDHLIDYRDVWLLSLLISDQAVVPRRKFPNTPTITFTPLASATPSRTPSFTRTPTTTTSPLPTVTRTATSTPTGTATATPSRTPVPLDLPLKLYPRAAGDVGVTQSGLLMADPGTCGSNESLVAFFTTQTVRHELSLTKDLASDRYTIHLWLGGVAQHNIRVIHKTTTSETILAAFATSTATALDSPQLFEATSDGLDPVAQTGDKLILEVEIVPDFGSSGIYIWGNCSDISTKAIEPIGHSWLLLEGSNIPTLTPTRTPTSQAPVDPDRLYPIFEGDDGLSKTPGANCGTFQVVRVENPNTTTVLHTYVVTEAMAADAYLFHLWLGGTASFEIRINHITGLTQKTLVLVKTNLSGQESDVAPFDRSIVGDILQAVPGDVIQLQIDIIPPNPGDVGVYLFGNCAEIGGVEPEGFSWISLKSNITGTPSRTPTVTLSPTPGTPLPTNTPTDTATATVTNTPGTPTRTPTGTILTPTRTRTPTNTPTPTGSVLSPTPTPTGVTTTVYARRFFECSNSYRLDPDAGPCGSFQTFNGPVGGQHSAFLAGDITSNLYRLHFYVSGNAADLRVRVLLRRSGSVDLVELAVWSDSINTAVGQWRLIDQQIQGINPDTQAGDEIILEFKDITTNPIGGYRSGSYAFGNCEESPTDADDVEEIGYTWMRFGGTVLDPGCTP